MTAFVACCSHRPRLFRALGLLFIAAAACAIQRPALAADPTPVSHRSCRPGQGSRLPERTATLVVGNPLIADAAVQPGGIIVITAKSYGVTNLVALDRTGTTLMEHAIQVLGPVDNVIVLYRGVERESYSCTPNCERRIMLGDTPNYFTSTLNQTSNLNSLAQGGQQK